MNNPVFVFVYVLSNVPRNQARLDVAKYEMAYKAKEEEVYFLRGHLSQLSEKLPIIPPSESGRGQKERLVVEVLEMTEAKGHRTRLVTTLSLR
jgi:hypothetical protein